MSAAALACAVGTFAGTIAGYYRGLVDTVVSRLVDIQLAFPVILLALGVLAVAGPSLRNLIFVLVVVDWARYARVVRSGAISQARSDYVEAAQALGASHRRVMIRHLIPNLASTVIVMASYSAALMLLTESALSFLGLGVAPPAITWGGMIGSSRDYIHQAWWTVTFPGIAVTLVVLALNWLGDGLRDALDPRER
jgi:peptide/nickel transport system permease protein